MITNDESRDQESQESQEFVATADDAGTNGGQLDEEDAQISIPRGPRPGFREAMRHKCFDCMGDMLDGRTDCEVTACSLYYWQPYRRLIPDLTWRTEGSHLTKNRAALRERIENVRRQYKSEV